MAVFIQLGNKKTWYTKLNCWGFTTVSNQNMYDKLKLADVLTEGMVFYLF